MKTIDEIRFDNLKYLVDKAGGLTELVELSNNKLSRPALYQILSGVKTAKGADKNVGPDLARKIEDALRLERGWMDNSREIVQAAPVLGVETDKLLKLIKLFSESTENGQQQILDLAGITEKRTLSVDRDAAGNEA